MMRVAAGLLVMSLACGFAAPALCAGSTPKPMPCCDPDRDCGAALGRPSCCADSPADGNRAPGAPADATSRAVVVTTAALPAAMTDLVIPVQTASTEVRPMSGAAPPLFLLHTTFLC